MTENITAPGRLRSVCPVGGARRTVAVYEFSAGFFRSSNCPEAHSTPLSPCEYQLLVLPPAATLLRAFCLCCRVTVALEIARLSRSSALRVSTTSYPEQHCKSCGSAKSGQLVGTYVPGAGDADDSPTRLLGRHCYTYIF